MASASHQRKVSIIGLGYVGLPVAVEFGKRGRTVGFDVDKRRIAELLEGNDRRGEISPEELAAADLLLSADAKVLHEADFHIVAVPTPVDTAHRPDLQPLISA